MSKLPVELVDAIMQHFQEEGDTAALSASALVCRSWVAPAQKGLLRELWIWPDSENYTPGPFEVRSRCKSGLRVLSASTHLCQYIRSVELRIGAKLLNNEALHSLLRLLPVVKSLSAYGIYNWKDLPTPLILALQHIVSNPTFETLRLTYFNFTPSGHELLPLLRCCSKSIKTLSLTYVNRYIPDATPEIDSDPLVLTNLREFSVLGEIPDFGGAITMPHLQILHQDMSGDISPSSDNIQALKSCVPASLLGLSLRHWQNFEPIEDFPSFSSLGDYRHLRHLHFESCFGTELQSIVQFFQAIPLRDLRELEYLSFRIAFVLGRENVLRTCPWSPLATAIPPLLALGRLKTFLLAFEFEDVKQRENIASPVDVDLRKYPYVRDFAAQVRHQLRDLHAAGILKLRLLKNLDGFDEDIEVVTGKVMSMVYDEQY